MQRLQDFYKQSPRKRQTLRFLQNPHTRQLSPLSTRQSHEKYLVCVLLHARNNNATFEFIASDLAEKIQLGVALSLTCPASL